jgi:UDP-glucose 4-epimerase
MNVLITGGRGFVGRYLVRLLKETGHQPIVLNPNFDITGINNAAFKALKGVEIDAVVHLAALLMIDGHQATEYFRVNSLGTLNVLEFCRYHGVKKFIYTMTHSDLNGTDGVISSNDPVNFKTGSWEHNSIPFITSKIAGQLMLEAYYRAGAFLQAYTLRLSNIRGYGSKDAKYNCVFHQFIQKAIKGEDIEIWGNPPKTRRDIIYVKDVCYAIIDAINTRTKEYKLLNIGSGIGYTIEEEAKEIIEVFSPADNKSRLIYRPDIEEVRKKGQIFDRVDAWAALNWKPKYSYREALQDYKYEMEKNLK